MPPTSVALREIVEFLDRHLDVAAAADEPNALNGLQVEADGPVERIALAVDASEAVIRAARDWADLLIVHHGLFWAGLRPLTGVHFRRTRALIESGTALYSVHLPLDSHPEVGNAVVLARKLGLTALEPFGRYRDTTVGYMGRVAESRGQAAGPEAGGAPATRKLAEFVSELSTVVGQEVVTLRGGPDDVATVGIVTGGGAGWLYEAAALGLDVLITGEARHYQAIDAAELGVTVLLGGHYATETWGVRALGQLLADRFGIEGRFVDSPVLLLPQGVDAGAGRRPSITGVTGD